tara:strand:+ start:80 stop:283 length:204 start_codon:yes stop_codon:yes gene_type:complete
MDKLNNNYLNIPTIKIKRLILNSPLEKDYETIQCFLKSERSKFIGRPYVIVYQAEHAWFKAKCKIKK